MMKDTIIKRLKDNLEDMECHPFNEYRDFDERVLFLSVEQIRWMYDYLTNEKNENDG